MTMQQRITIDPTDILAVEYQCKKCQSRYAVAIDSIVRSQMTCPNCNVGWIKGRYVADRDERTETAVADFAFALQKLRSMAMDEGIVRIEILLPVKP